jgi:ADP-ribose pyrophosphatase
VVVIFVIFSYVDDPRNTDNAWMETVAFSFHDETGNQIGKFDLKAGDDAKDLKWMKLSADLELYASHKLFLHKVAIALNAHW